METAKDYFKPEALGISLTVEQIGNTVHEDIDISIDDIQSEFLLDITLEKKESAHIAVYYVGEPVQKTTFGMAGCIGCICRPDRPVSRLGWVPRGADPNFKHCTVAKTKNEIKQGKVSSFFKKGQNVYFFWYQPMVQLCYD